MPGSGLFWTKYQSYRPGSHTNPTQSFAPSGTPSDKIGGFLPDDPNVERFESSPIDELVAGSTNELAPMLNAARRQVRFNLLVLVFFLSLLIFEIPTHLQSTMLPTAIFGFVVWLGATYFDHHRLTISLEYNLQDDQTRAYQEFSNAFRELVKSRRVWRIPAKIGQSDWKRHAGASTTIERNPISLSVSTPNLINSNLEFMCVPLGTKNLYFTPDAILLVAGNSVAALHYDDLEIGCEPTRFIENEKLPGDAEVVGESWIYVNKDGTADRRFGNNKKLPICLYGEIYLKSAGGLNERIHCSRLNAAKEFVACAVAMRHTNSVAVKIGGTSTHTFPTEDLARREELDPTLAFAKESEKARTLTLEHREFWGYLLTEELLKSKLRVLKSECDEFEKTVLLIPKGVSAARIL